MVGMVDVVAVVIVIAGSTSVLNNDLLNSPSTLSCVNKGPGA